MQRMELSFIAKLPDSHRSLIGEGQPVILDITVIAVEDAENEKEADPTR
jgi:hypothetical protein